MRCFWRIFALLFVLLASCPAAEADFPLPLQAYDDPGDASLFEILQHRIRTDPFNAVATVLFLLAIIHTFLAAKFTNIAHHWKKSHEREIEAKGLTAEAKSQTDAKADVSFKAEIMHFLGEIEAIFGIWVVPLLGAIVLAKSWHVAEEYISHRVSFTEPMFVVVIMCIAATRPVLLFAEATLRFVARLGGGRPAAWWLSTLTLGPLLGSFITEPAAMTICAMLLARKIYELRPSPRLSYATLGLLFVNISVGGTLTHFAAPPVLMVATAWHWDTLFMLTRFGWKAALGIVVANALYFVWFRRELCGLREEPPPAESPPQPPGRRQEARTGARKSAKSSA